jgi:hypothetical protein
MCYVYIHHVMYIVMKRKQNVLQGKQDRMCYVYMQHVMHIVMNIMCFRENRTGCVMYIYMSYK